MHARHQSPDPPQQLSVATSIIIIVYSPIEISLDPDLEELCFGNGLKRTILMKSRDGGRPALREREVS